MDMVLRSVDAAREQCSFSNDAFGLNGCCAQGQSSLCNRPCPVFSIEGEWDRHKPNVDATFKDDSLSFSDIQSVVDAEYVVECGLLWSHGGGHAVLIVGYESDEDGVEQVIVLDPQREKLEIPYSELTNAYGLGRWRWSWRVERHAHI